MWQRILRWISLKQRRHSRLGYNEEKKGSLFSCCTIGILILIIFTITVLTQITLSFLHLPANLRLQQRCRMSRMWPGYVRYEPPSPVGLNSKYKLFLYRESPPGSNPSQPAGRPAIFVPGNAGSYGQVRSVASSSHNLFQREESSEDVKGEIDWWTIDFNEDFTAFHGETMREQAVYLNDVIAFLRSSIYKNTVKVPILAHSMGGIVARLMMLQDNYVHQSVETIITLSTPHAYPPVPIEKGLEEIYQQIATSAETNSQEVLLISLSGGILDDQLSSEASSFDLARIWKSESSLHAFTSTLAALWTGVDHLAMMWCDQLRERIARGVLRIEGGEKSMSDRREAWRRMLGINRLHRLEHTQLPLQENHFDLSDSTNDRTVQRELYKIPIYPFETFNLVTPHNVGMDKSFGPPVEQDAVVRVALCDVNKRCRYLLPSAYDTIPPSQYKSNNGKTDDIFPKFPISELRYELSGNALHRLVITKDDLDQHVTNEILVEQKSMDSFALNQFVKRTESVESLSKKDSFTFSRAGKLESSLIVEDMDSTLMAYTLHILARDVPKSCKELHQEIKSPAPILHVQSLSTGDQQWYPSIEAGDTLQLMLHGSSPFMPPSRDNKRGMKFTLMMDTCQEIAGIRIKVDWKTSAGLILSRYRTAIAAFPLAIVLLISSIVWEQWDQGAQFPNFLDVLINHMPFAVSILLAISWSASILQRIAFTWYGVNKNELFINLAFGIPFSSVWHSILLAFFFVPTTYGIVIFVAAVLQTITKIFAFVMRSDPESLQIKANDGFYSRRNLVISSIAFSILAFTVFIFVPYQFVFLVLFVIQFFVTTKSNSNKRGANDALTKERLDNVVHQNILILNLFFWLLPLNAPILLIWSRNLLNGWYGTLGKTDHNILKITGFILVNFISQNNQGFPRIQFKLGSLLTAILFFRGTILGIIYGIRYTWTLFEATNVALICLALMSLYTKARSNPSLPSTRGETVEESYPLFNAEIKEDEIQRSDIPASISKDGTDYLPASIEASLKDGETLEGYKISNRPDDIQQSDRSQQNVLDVLLEEYLATIDTYMKLQSSLSQSLASGLFQLSKARMQLGLPYLTQSWDARMKASRGVESVAGKVQLKRLEYEQEEEKEMTIIHSLANASTLRRRKGKDEANEKDISQQKESKKEEEIKRKPAAPYDPLFQFSGLPPQSLRKAQSDFVGVLDLAIGQEEGKESLINTRSKLLQLEQKIRNERKRLGMGP